MDGLVAEEPQGTDDAHVGRAQKLYRRPRHRRGNKLMRYLIIVGLFLCGGCSLTIPPCDDVPGWNMCVSNETAHMFNNNDLSMWANLFIDEWDYHEGLHRRMNTRE